MRLLVVGSIAVAALVARVTEPPITSNSGVASGLRLADDVVERAARATMPPRGPASPSFLDLACSTSLSAITPCAGAQTASMNAGGSVTFTVQNKTIEPVSYQLTCGRTNVVATCSSPGSVQVNGNSTKTVSVGWTTGGSAGTGTLSLTADDGSAPVTGTVVFTVAAPTATALYVAQVSPHLQRHLVDSGQADTARFVVRNVGEDSTGWSWSVACTGNAIVGNSCSNTSGTVGLAVGAQTTVAVAYTTGGANNALGQVLLRQWRTGQDSVRDSGFVEVQIVRNDSLVQVSQQNPGESNAPDQCVTVSVARGLAAECGALRAVHAFPSLRTYGKVRAPVLLYNSQHAHPRPVIRLDVTLPDARIPDSVVAIAYDSSGAAIAGARGSWTGSQWRARSTRRVTRGGVVGRAGVGARAAPLHGRRAPMVQR